MKIIKHGKIEERRFVCPSCGCEFTASISEVFEGGYMYCPEEGCSAMMEWADGVSAKSDEDSVLSSIAITIEKDLLHSFIVEGMKQCQELSCDKCPYSHYEEHCDARLIADYLYETGCRLVGAESVSE